MHSVRNTLLTALCLTISVGLYGQDFLGIWRQYTSRGALGLEAVATEYIEIMEGGTTRDRVFMVIRKVGDENTSNHLNWRVDSKGVWAIKDDVLTLTFDNKSVTTEALEMPGSIPQFAVSTLTKAILAAFRSETKNPIHYKIISLTTDAMQLRPLDNPSTTDTSDYTRITDHQVF